MISSHAVFLHICIPKQIYSRPFDIFRQRTDHISAHAFYSQNIYLPESPISRTCFLVYILYDIQYRANLLHIITHRNSHKRPTDIHYGHVPVHYGHFRVVIILMSAPVIDLSLPRDAYK